MSCLSPRENFPASLHICLIGKKRRGNRDNSGTIYLKKMYAETPYQNRVREIILIRGSQGMFLQIQLYASLVLKELRDNVLITKLLRGLRNANKVPVSFGHTVTQGFSSQSRSYYPLYLVCTSRDWAALSCIVHQPNSECTNASCSVIDISDASITLSVKRTIFISEDLFSFGNVR